MGGVKSKIDLSKCRLIYEFCSRFCSKFLLKKNIILIPIAVKITFNIQSFCGTSAEGSAEQRRQVMIR